VPESPEGRSVWDVILLEGHRDVLERLVDGSVRIVDAEAQEQFGVGGAESAEFAVADFERTEGQWVVAENAASVPWVG